MNRFFLSIIIMLLVHAAHAQTDSIVIWNKWCSKKDTLLLYARGNNMLQMCSKDIKMSNIILKPLDRTLKIGKPEIKNDTLSVLAMPFAKGDKKMKLAVTNKATKKIIKTFEFASADIPEPEAQFGNLKHVKEATKDEILGQIALRVTFPNSLYSYPYRVIEYTFKIHNGSKTDSVLVSGFMIPQQVIKDVFASPLGATIEFTGIKASCPECEMRMLKDIKLKMK